VTSHQLLLHQLLFNYSSDPSVWYRGSNGGQMRRWKFYKCWSKWHRISVSKGEGGGGEAGRGRREGGEVLLFQHLKWWVNAACIVASSSWREDEL